MSTLSDILKSQCVLPKPNEHVTSETKYPARRKRAQASYTCISNEDREELVRRVTENKEKIAAVRQFKDLRLKIYSLGREGHEAELFDGQVNYESV